MNYIAYALKFSFWAHIYLTHLYMCLKMFVENQEKMRIERQQVLHLFRKVMVKFYKYFYDVLTKELDMRFPQDNKVSWRYLATRVFRNDIKLKKSINFCLLLHKSVSQSVMELGCIEAS